MLKYFILLILSYIVRSQNVDNDALAKAFLVPASLNGSIYTNATDAVSCYKSNNYKAGFLNVFSGSKFHSEVAVFFDPMQKNNISIQFVATPMRMNGSDVVSLIRHNLSTYGLSLDFLWIDMYYICQQDLTAYNIQFLTEIAQNVRVGIKSSFTTWLTCMKDWDASTLSNPLVWWEEENEVPGSFNNFPQFGSFEKASVISSLTWENCLAVNNSLISAIDLVYRIDDLKNELSTAPSPTIGGPTDPPFAYGDGMMLTMQKENQTFVRTSECLRKYYDTVFLSIYRVTSIDTKSTYIIPALLNASFTIQPMITPDYTQRRPEDVLDVTLRVMASYGIVTEFVWINTEFMYQGVDVTIPFLRNMSSTIKRRNMTMGIMTTSLPWIELMNDWKELAADGVILWDMEELNSIGSYIPFGGWSKPYAYSNDYNVASCEGTRYYADAQKAKYNIEVINPVRLTTTPVTTTQAPNNLTQAIYIVYNAQMAMKNTTGVLNCLRGQGYKAAFIQIFELTEVSDWMVKFVPELYAAGFDVYPIMIPSQLSYDEAKYQINEIQLAFAEIGFKINFLFYDTYYGDDSIRSFNTLNGVNKAAQAQNITVGIFTNAVEWYEGFNYSTNYNTQPLFIKDLDDVKDFEFFAGWTSYTGYFYGDVDSCATEDETIHFDQAYYSPDLLRGFAVQSLNSTSTTQSSPNTSTTPLNNTTMPMASTLKPSNGTSKPLTTAMTTLKPANGTIMPYSSTAKPANSTSKSSISTLKLSTTAIPTKDPVIASGLVLSSDGPSIPIDMGCVKSNGYETVFLQIYYQYQFNFDLANQTFSIMNASLNVQYVAQPDFAFQRISPEYEVQSILQFFQMLGLYPEFLWIDTTVLGNNVTNNIDYLSRLRKECSRLSINTGIMASSVEWFNGMNNDTKPSTDGQILWDISSNSSFRNFSPYGGWETPIVISAPSLNKCPPKEHRLKVSDVLYIRSGLDFFQHTTPATTNPVRTTTFAKSSSIVPPTKPTPTKTISTSTVETSTKASSILMFSHVLLISIASYIL